MTTKLRTSDLVARNAVRAPHGPAIIDHASSVTWRALDAGANRLASGLLRLGLSRSARVAMIMKSGPAVIEAVYALAKAGLVSVPINHGLTEREIQVLLGDCEPRCILADDEFADALADTLRATRAIVVVRGQHATKAGADWRDYDDVKAQGSGEFDDSAVRPDDIRTIRYTSGTTAEPKGCIGTHSQTLSSIKNYFQDIQVPATGPFLQLLPLFSGAGIWQAFAAAYRGLPIVMLPAFKPREALKAIEYARVSHTYGVPTIVGRLTEAYEAADYELSSLRLFGYGGSPMPSSVIRRALTALPCAFYQGYGGGEMGGLISFLKPEHHAAALSDDLSAERLKSVGQPATYAEIRIRDMDGSVLDRQAVGEITVKSVSNFSGYWKRPEETAETLRGDWVYSGDMGYFDESGFLYVVDRKKDMVLTGGMNVSSAEVEAVLMEQPDIADAAVIGLPDEEWGEVVTAVVVLRSGTATTEREILQHVRSSLAGYKTPKSVKFMSALPRNRAGKVLKRQLRDRFSGSLGRS